MTISATILELLQFTEQDSTLHCIYAWSLFWIWYIVYRAMKTHLFSITPSAVYMWLLITCQPATFLYEKLRESADFCIILCLSHVRQTHSRTVIIFWKVFWLVFSHIYRYMVFTGWAVLLHSPAELKHGKTVNTHLLIGPSRSKCCYFTG